MEKEKNLKEIGKWKKQIKNAASSAIGIGWFQCIVFAAFLLFRIFTDVSKWWPEMQRLPLSLLVASMFFGVFSVIYGRRLKNIEDINTQRTIKILFWGLLGLSLLVIFAGAIPGGFLYIILAVNYSLALSAHKKLQKVEEFTAQMKKIEYKFTDKHLIYFALGSVLLVGLSAYLNPYILNFGANAEYSRKSSFGQWQEYEPIAGLFKIKLPAQPTHLVKDESGDQKSYRSAKSEHEIYAIDYIKLPESADIADPAGGLQAIMGNITKSAGAVFSDDSTTFRGWPARDFLMYNQGAYIMGKIFFAHDTVYILSFAYTGGYWNADDYNAFIESFNLF